MEEKKELLMKTLNGLDPNNPSYVSNISEVIKNSGYNLNWVDEKNGHTLLIDLFGYDNKYMKLLDEEEGIYGSHIDIIIELIKLGVDLDIRDNSGDTALIIACNRNFNNQEIYALLDAKANVNIKNNEGKTALFYGHNTDIKERLIKEGADIKSIDNKGQTVLFDKHYIHVTLNFLLNSGANPNHIDNDGNTPLIYLCKTLNFREEYDRELRIRVITSLITAGANVNIENNEGNTVLMYSKTVDEVQHLINAGADINKRNKKGQTALMFNNTTDNLNYVLHLISLGADVNLQDNEGKTALILLILNTETGVWGKNTYKGFRFLDLLRGGSLVHIRDNDGKTALDYAFLKERGPFVIELLKSKLDLENAEFILHNSIVSGGLPSNTPTTDIQPDVNDIQQDVNDSQYHMETVVKYYLDGKKKSHKNRNKLQKKGKKSLDGKKLQKKGKKSHKKRKKSLDGKKSVERKNAKKSPKFS